MQLEDPSYFYSIQLDDDNQIMNIFWANSRSIVDYGHLGMLYVLTPLIEQIHMVDPLLHLLGLIIINNQLSLVQLYFMMKP